MAPRRVVVVAFEDVHGIDVCGPLEVFAGASRWAREAGGSDGGFIRSLGTAPTEYRRFRAGGRPQPQHP